MNLFLFWLSQTTKKIRIHVSSPTTKQFHFSNVSNVYVRRTNRIDIFALSFRMTLRIHLYPGISNVNN